MLGEETWRVRFPTIWHSCRRAGINPATDLIPVAPACHYFCGGVETDIDGATNLIGLYACGEVASSGVHGANRLASNSCSKAWFSLAGLPDSCNTIHQYVALRRRISESLD
jgi:L-aspartate oxidase